MDSRPIGVVGAYGAAGTVVARTLVAQSQHPLVLVGRNPQKLQELAGSLGGRASIATADVMDPAALVRACEGCGTIVNCAAPSTTVLDRVAQAALQLNCQYVDAGGDAIVFQELESQQEQIRSKGLTFILGAGYVPGLLEMFVRAIYEVHRGQSGAAVSVKLFVVDRNEWSLNGFVDMVERFCRHPPEIGVYEAGRFVPKSMLTAWVRRELPGQPSAVLVMPVKWDELEPFVDEAKPKQAAVYMPIDPVLYVVGRFFARFKPDRTDLAAKVARLTFRLKAKRQGSGGMLYGEASGRPGRSPLRWFIDVPEGRHYEHTGQVAALAAAMTADGTIRAPGLHYLAHVVDPHDFITRLRVWGVETVDLTIDEATGGGSDR